jgi:hypothetical protein
MTLRHRRLSRSGAILFAVAASCMMPGSGRLAAQSGVSAGKTTASSATSRGGSSWTVPRLPDGHPDLQGTWANNYATPFERPKELADHPRLSDEEVAALRAHAAELFAGDSDAAFGDAVFVAALKNIGKYKAGGLSTPGAAVAGDGFDKDTGNYNEFWLVDREFDNRTSLVTDPPDGRVPPLTPEAAKRIARANEQRSLHPADGPEDRPLGERCLSFGYPRLNAGYNSYYQIFQTHENVAILNEMGHDAHIVLIDAKAALSDRIRQWNGSSRGHWEGDTLVIETANYSPASEFRGAAENLRVTERYTRTGPTTLKYEATFADEGTWTKPWTVMIPLRRTDEHIYEYACHEGNIAMVGILSGARAKEKQRSADHGSKDR